MQLEEIVAEGGLMGTQALLVCNKGRENLACPCQQGWYYQSARKTKGRGGSSKPCTSAAGLQATTIAGGTDPHTASQRRRRVLGGIDPQRQRKGETCGSCKRGQARDYSER
ncbi:hypothetical protein L7F22_057512 [Adiantum nelumboides]|nr:hypothetical protein [Adiantum nelumboides]